MTGRNFLSAATVALGFFSAIGWSDSALADRRVALVIGNAAYQNAPALANPSKDAQVSLLKIQFGAIGEQ